MKNISELKNKYLGQKVVIFVSGESHLKYNKDEDCIKCGINYTFENQKVDYLFIGELETFELIRKHFDESKIIIPNLTGLNKHKTGDRYKIEDGSFYEYILQNPSQNKSSDLPNKYCGLDESLGFVSYTTTTHSALHILCYMGFKEIDIYGMDYKKYSNGKVHFTSKLSDDYNSQNWFAGGRFKEGDNYIIPRLEKEFECKIINKGINNEYKI